MTTLHVRCGSDIRDGLRAAGIEGDFLEWADPVCQGPVRRLPEPEYLEERRAWISGAWDIPRAEVDEKLLGVSSLVERARSHDEVCLWFEHDWYDQSMLVLVLAGLADATDLHPKLRIVSIDRHPEVERFLGLGQLRPEQLSPLYADRREVNPDALVVATRAFDALRDATPDRLRTTDWSSEGLPFLAAAIRRHLEELPGERDGLGLTQRLILSEIARTESAGAFAAAVFGRFMSELDPQPFLGDLMFWAYLRELAVGPHPLLTMLGDFPSEQLSLTELGHQVLRGDQSWLDVAGPTPSGPSRWRGGVEIVGGG